MTRPTPPTGVSLILPPPMPEGEYGVQLLRVSTLGQVKTDYDPDGISIPAQRTANSKRADSMNVTLTKEFIEPGVSGRSMDKRPTIKELLTYLKKNRHIKFVFIYALSRLARNRTEDAILSDALKKMGVTLVSATEDIHDGSPTAEAMHGMLAVFNQLRSDMDGADIAYKMGEKAKNGGTLGTARLGYLNDRETIGDVVAGDQRSVATVIVDPERGHLITQMWELYATGRYGYHDLREIMTARGLTSRPRKGKPAGPLSLNGISSILTSRYYLGEVCYKGEWLPGRHPALVTPEVFDKVQQVRIAQGGAGNRQRVHQHHLKGGLWCGRCRRHRLIVEVTDGNGGQYKYFYCAGRKLGTCTLPYLPLDGWRGVEAAISARWDAVALDETLCREISGMADEIIASEHDTAAHLRRQLSARLKELDAQETGLVACIGQPDMPAEKITEQLRQVRRDMAALKNQLEHATTQLGTGRELLALALDMLTQPRRAYDGHHDTGKGVLFQSIFKRVYLDADTDPITTKVTGHELEEPFATLHAAVQRHKEHSQTEDGGQAQTHSSGGRYPLKQVVTPAEWNPSARSSTKALWVEVPGIEPGSSAALSGLLRVQSAVPLLGPTVHADETV
jgi:site-specific DNA recombinase